MVLSDQFDLSGVARLDQRLRPLFGLRDEGAHTWDSLAESVPHPTGVANVAVQVATYTADEVERSVDLAFSILDACASYPRAGKPDTKRWADDHREAVRRLIALRTSS